MEKYYLGELRVDGKSECPDAFKMPAGCDRLIDAKISAMTLVYPENGALFPKLSNLLESRRYDMAR